MQTVLSVFSFSISLAYIATFIAVHNLQQAHGKNTTHASHSQLYERLPKIQQQIYMLLQNPHSPFAGNESENNQLRQEILPNQSEIEELKEKLSHLPRPITEFPKGSICSFFDTKISDAAMKISQYLAAIPSLEEFLKTCAYLHDNLNDELYIFAMLSSLMRRPDTKEMPLPSIEYIFPQMFIPSPILKKAARRLMAAPDENEIFIEGSTFELGNYRNLEAILGYFRDDICVNSQHYYWHLVYRNNVISQDRHGELFIFIHRQFLARYNADRLSSNLSTVEPYNFTTPLLEGHDATNFNNISGANAASREPNAAIMSKDQGDIENLELWLSNIYHAINSGVVQMRKPTDDGTMSLSNGISIIGEVIETNSGSKYYNPGIYGNYHGSGHVLISYINNPPPGTGGIMLKPAMSMKDPAFYRWHMHVDNIANDYQIRLPPYSYEELSLKDVSITSIHVIGNESQTRNDLTTFWKRREVNVQSGLDFARKLLPVILNLIHLDHEPFNHTITIWNAASKVIDVTVRLFIAPKHYRNGTEIPFKNLRRMFITLDIFRIAVTPGANTITRESKDSSVTIPPGLSFNQLAENKSTNHYCGCGWPDHLLLPRGRTDGMPFIYFAMLTDGEDYNDTVLDPRQCTTASAFCGLPNQKYPDKRAMGYPFDRKAKDSVTTIMDFVITPNMIIGQIIIRHNDSLLHNFTTSTNNAMNPDSTTTSTTTSEHTTTRTTTSEHTTTSTTTSEHTTTSTTIPEDTTTSTTILEDTTTSTTIPEDTTTSTTILEDTTTSTTIPEDTTTSTTILEDTTTTTTIPEDTTTSTTTLEDTTTSTTIPEDTTTSTTIPEDTTTSTTILEDTTLTDFRNPNRKRRTTQNPNDNNGNELS